jgi:hypothetical protein
MIKIVRNQSFPQWLDIFAFGEFIEQVQGRAKALKVAKKLARQHGEKAILFNGNLVDSND